MRRRHVMRAGAGALAVPLTAAVSTADDEFEPLEVVDHHTLGGDPDEEYITLRNTGTEPIDATGWTLEDDGLVPAETLTPFAFPRGFTLEPEAEVTIVTGEGEDTDEELHWDVARQIWSEDGDVVYVRDETGDLVLEQSIPIEERERDR